jgi:hypothetical protein
MRAEPAPLQDRADPFGELCAVDARGTLMGNRGGRLHRDDRTLGTRRHVSRRWIACVCEFKNRHRKVWGDSYTEIFFLDEVTALAGGHRPCFECRRADAKDFMARFEFAEGESVSVDAMDLRLHAERLDGRNKRMFRASAAILPDGAMFACGKAAFAVRDHGTLAWSHHGYTARSDLPRGDVDVLTPPSIIEALARGYQPHWHASADNPIPLQR